MSQSELYPMVFKNRCGHTTTITCSPDDAGQLVAEQSFELCAICDQAIWEKEHEAAIDAYERAMEENFIAEELPIIRPNRCSHFNAICPKAGVCYGNVEIVNSQCSEGMVLVHDVDDPSNRCMYHISTFKDDSTEDPCFHCKNLGLDTVDNCSGCSGRLQYASTDGCDEPEDQPTVEDYHDVIPF